MTEKSHYIDRLRCEVWKKAVGTSEIEYAPHYYDLVRKSIGKATGNHFHRDTIRNFFEGHHSPRPRTLDIYSTFVLGGDEDHPRTFQEFIQSREQVGAAPPPRRKTHRHRKALIFLLGLPVLLLAGYFLIFPAARSETVDRSIAVLPFRVIGNPDAQQYFANGVTEAIINHLAGIGELLVISRTSVEQYRQTTKTIPEIAAELDVGYVLEGSIQRSGDQIRITVQLIDGQTDRHQWSQTFDRPAEEIFDIQTEIAASVANALRVEIQPTASGFPSPIPTGSFEAYEYFLRGQQRYNEAIFLLGEERKPAFLEAEILFRRAIALDPAFDRPYVSLAKVHTQIMAGKELLQFSDSIKFLCNQALALNPGNHEAYLQRAAYFEQHGQERTAKADLLKAYELNAHDPDVNLRLANFLLTHQNDYLEAYTLLNKVLAVEHSPQSLQLAYYSLYRIYLDICDFEKARLFARRYQSFLPKEQQTPLDEIWLLRIAGNFPEALALAEQSIDSTDKHTSGIFGALHLEAGNYQKAVHYFQQEKDVIEQKGFLNSDEFLLFLGRYGQALYLSGRQEEGMKMIRKGIARIREYQQKTKSRKPLYDLAGFYAFTGDRENAIKCLQAEQQWRHGIPYFIEHDIQFAKLRDDPEFKAIVRKAQEEKRKVRKELELLKREEQERRI